VLRIGMPIGLTILAESGLFAAALYVMGVLGTEQLAAHAIALQCAAVAFMVPLGIGQAATVRVGLAAGRGDRPAVGRAGWIALGLGAGFSFAPAVVFWVLPHAVVGLFLDLSAAGSLEVAAIAVTFLAVAAVFQLFDGLQIIAAGALRGLKDTRTPMLVALFSYWPVGFGACLLLAFPAGLGGLGIWLGLALGLVVVAGLLVWRFHRRERFWRPPAPVSPAATPPAGA
jgi:MATE family multidrug resistance protein